MRDKLLMYARKRVPEAVVALIAEDSRSLSSVDAARASLTEEEIRLCLLIARDKKLSAIMWILVIFLSSAIITALYFIASLQ